MGIDNFNPPRDLSLREKTLARIKFPNLKVIRMELIEKTFQRRLVIIVVDIGASMFSQRAFYNAWIKRTNLLVRS